MAGRLRGWRALSWHERGKLLLLVLLALALPWLGASLRLFGYGPTRRWLEQRSPQAGSRARTAQDLHSAERLAVLAGIAGRHGAVMANCLPQSLLVYWLLRRRGWLPEIRIGVRKQDGEMGAHAWVELDGVALAQRELAHQPFALPGRVTWAPRLSAGSGLVDAPLLVGPAHEASRRKTWRKLCHSNAALPCPLPYSSCRYPCDGNTRCHTQRARTLGLALHAGQYGHRLVQQHALQQQADHLRSRHRASNNMLASQP